MAEGEKKVSGGHNLLIRCVCGGGGRTLIAGPKTRAAERLHDY